MRVRSCPGFPVNETQQFAAPQRPDQVDFLPREIAVNVKRARIEKIPRRPRANKRFDAINRVT